MDYPENYEERCTCDEYDWEEHTCPFKQDMYDDNETLCACCPYCIQQCIDDI